MVARSDGRRAMEVRPVEIIRGYTDHAAGSVLIGMGKTRVLCTASFEQGVPKWREESGCGWLTAEYDMVPAATVQRRARSRMRIDGRTQEIQRLIGRALRAVVDLSKLGPNTIWLDCDVLQADGGTRTASITGAYVALCDAVRVGLARGWLSEWPVSDSVAAISVGRVGGRILLDLTYEEDSAAEVDLNVAMTGSGRFVEIQGSGESASFTRSELERMLTVAGRGIGKLLAAQQEALGGGGRGGRRGRGGGKLARPAG